MTEIQQLHHDEQMEAMRRDFALLWVRELIPKIGTNDPRKIAAAQHKAWTEFSRIRLNRFRA